MPIRREKNWLKVNTQLRTVVQEAVSAAAITMSIEMFRMLSKPGRGKIYARGAAGAKFDKIGRYGQISLEAATAERFGELLARRAARDSGKRRKNLTRRNQGFHRASRFPDPPAVDTGHLRRSVDYREGNGIDGSQIKTGFPTAKVGTNVEYGRYLEFGTRKMLRREWARPAAKKARPKIVSVFRTMLSRIGRVT